VVNSGKIRWIDYAPEIIGLESEDEIQEKMPRDTQYLDHSDLLSILKKAYSSHLYALLIGPKGTGKTLLVQKVAEELKMPMYSMNFSVGIREEMFIGTPWLEDNKMMYRLGVVPRSMLNGGILYLDEINSADPDVLVRLNEVLDDRRQLYIPDIGRTIKAKDGWWVVATINPLSSRGTKVLPEQILSRFGIKIAIDYPSESEEIAILEFHYGDFIREHISEIKKAITLANILRKMVRENEEIIYAPSIRELMAFAALLKAGVESRLALEIALENVYTIWGIEEKRKVGELIDSLWNRGDNNGR